MSAVDRRAFLRGLAAAAAGTAAAPAASLPATPLAARNRAAVAWHPASCTLCSVGCGMLVGVQDGRAVAAKGDPDSPVSRGLACAKGYHAVQTLYGRDRITRPLIRRGGELVPATLDQALDRVAQQLRGTLESRGPDAIALYGAADRTLTAAHAAELLFRDALGSGSIDSEARLHGGSGSVGLAGSFGSDEPVCRYDDIDDADVFVLWGTNIAETQPVLHSRILARRRTDPAVRIIDLAARTTRTSYAADRSLLHAPYAQIAVANAICHEIVARRLTNRAFVDRHVSFRKGPTDIGSGLDADVVTVEESDASSWSEYVAFLDAYAPDRAQRITGVPAADIRWLAGLYGDRARRVMSLWGSELNRHPRGTWLNNAICNIHLLVGKVAAPGSGPFCLSLPAPPVAPAGRTALAIFRALEEGDVRFLWIQSADPLLSLPHLDRYRRAASGDGRFIVVSAAYPTPTTDIADVVLPTSLPLERESIAVNAERRVQYTAQLVQPPGDATDESWQISDVAHRLGLAQRFPWPRDRHVEGLWDDRRARMAATAPPPPTLAALRAAPAGAPHRRYDTAHDTAADPAYGAFDFYGTDDHRARIWLRPHEPPAEPANGEYPFTLLTGAVLEHADTGTLTRRIPTLHRAVPRSYVELNADDARSLGVRSGDTVRLVSRRGALRIEARIDHRSQPGPGVVFAPWFDETHPVNELVNDTCCPLSGQPDYGCAVRVERVAAGVRP